MQAAYGFTAIHLINCLMASSTKGYLFMAVLFLYVVFITLLYLTPYEFLPKIRISRIDNLVHIISYAGLAWLVLAALDVFKLRKRSHLILGVVFLLVHAIVVESVQGLWTEINRHARSFDLLLNIIGVALGILLRYIWLLLFVKDKKRVV